MNNQMLNATFGLAVLVICITAARAQWVQSNGPWGAEVTSLATDGTALFAGTYSGVFRSTDKGTSWTAINDGLLEKTINNLAVSGHTIFAGTHGNGLFRSTDNGASWTHADSGPAGSLIVFLAAINTTVIAESYESGVFRSTDNGTSWIKIDTILNILALAAIGHTIFAGTGSDIVRSSDNGTNWSACTTGLAQGEVRSLAVSGNTILAGLYEDDGRGGIFQSTDNGTNWSAVNSDTYINSGLINYWVASFAVCGGNIFAATSGGIFRSTDNGTNWSAVNTAITNPYIWSLAVIDSTVFAGARFCGGVFRSADNGTSWTEVNSGLIDTYIPSIAAVGSRVFAGTDNGFLFLSTDNGMTWDRRRYGNVYMTIRSFAICNNTILAGTASSASGYTSGLFRSTDNGISWTNNNNGLSDTLWINALATSGNGTVFAGVRSEDGSINGIFRSTDNGITWTAVNSGLTDTQISALAVDSSQNIFTGTFPDGVFRSTDNGASWTAVNSGLPDTIFIASLAVCGNSILLASKHPDGLFRSTDKGTSWTAVNSGLPIGYGMSFTVSGNRGIFALTNGDVFLSTDDGTGWNEVDSGLPEVQSLAVSGSTIFAGTGGNGVWRRPLSEMIGATNVHPKQELLQKTNSSVRASGRPGSCVLIDLSLSHPDIVAIQIFNLSGRETALLVNRKLPHGSHSFRWDTRNITPGCYTVRVRAGSYTCIKSIPVFR